MATETFVVTESIPFISQLFPPMKMKSIILSRFVALLLVVSVRTNAQTLERTFGSPNHVGDIRAVAQHGNLIFTVGHDTAKVWLQTPSGPQYMQNLNGHGLSGIESIAILPPLWVFLGGSDAKITQWSLQNLTLINTFYAHAGPVYGLHAASTSSRPNTLFSGGQDGVMFEWNPATGVRVQDYRIVPISTPTNPVPPGSPIRAVFATMDFVYSGREDGTVQQWSFAAAVIVRSFTYASGINVRALYAVDTNVFVGGCEVGRIKKYDVDNGNLLATLAGHPTQGACTTVMTGRGSVFWSGGLDKIIRLYNTTTNIQVYALVGLSSDVTGLSVNVTTLISTGRQGDTRIWDTDTRATRINTQLSVPSRSQLFVAGSYMFAACGSAVEQYDLSSGSTQSVKTYSGHTLRISALHVYGDLLATGSDDLTVKLWAIPSGAQQYSLAVASPPTAVNLNADSVFIGMQDGALSKFSTSTGLAIASQNQHTANVNCLASTSKFVYSGADDSSVIEWSLDDLAKTRTFNTVYGARSIIISGSNMFVACSDAFVRQYNLDQTATTTIRTYNGPSGGFVSLALKGNALFVGEGLGSSQMRQFTVGSGSLVKSFGDHFSQVTSLAIYDKYLLSAAEKESLIKQWLVPDLIQTPRATTSRQASPTETPTEDPNSGDSSTDAAQNVSTLAIVIGSIAGMFVTAGIVLFVNRKIIEKEREKRRKAHEERRRLRHVEKMKRRSERHGHRHQHRSVGQRPMSDVEQGSGTDSELDPATATVVLREGIKYDKPIGAPKHAFKHSKAAARQSEVDSIEATNDDQ